MKKISIGVLALGLLFSGAQIQGAEPVKTVKEAEKPKKANVAAPTMKSFKASAEINRLAKEIKATRAKREKLQATFGAVHDAIDSRDPMAQGNQPTFGPEDLQTAIVSGKLGALMTILESQNDKGHGDLDYWIRTRSLLAMEGNLVVSELSRILSEQGGSINGLLRASIKNIATNLSQAMGKYSNGYGDLDYWVSASGYTRDALWQAAANIKEIREAIATPNAPDALPLIKAQLQVVQAFLSGQGDQGHGNIDYWNRTRSMLSNQSAVASRILRIIVDHYGSQMMGLLKTAITNVANNLEEVNRKYSNGYGDLDYWVGASSYTRDGLRSAGKNLAEVLSSI